MKISILEHLTNELKKDIKNIKDAHLSSKLVATGEEAKAESKWDTRAIEAGYLAGAQKARLTELEQELALLQDMKPQSLSHDDEIIIGALVELECNGHIRNYFLSPISGGKFLNINETPIMVVSVFSPIGKELLGLSSEDSFEIKTPSGLKEYVIRSVK